MQKRKTAVEIEFGNKRHTYAEYDQQQDREIQKKELRNRFIAKP